MPFNGAVYSGGNFVYTNTDFTGPAWQQPLGADDAAFIATFTNPVPLPSALPASCLLMVILFATKSGAPDQRRLSPGHGSFGCEIRSG
jgi:hypothetical protein